MDIVTMFKKLCDPAKLYLVLSLISVFFYVMSMQSANNTLKESDPEHEGIHHYTFMGLFMKIAFTLLWIYILNYLCKYKWGRRIAWFVVLLPFFIMGLVIVGMLCAVSVMAIQSRRINKLENGELLKKPTGDVVPKRPYQVAKRPQGDQGDQGDQGQIGFTL